MAINFNLPVFNGEIYAGLAAATDLSLPAAEKLSYIADADVGRAAIMTAASCLSRVPAASQPWIRELTANAAYAIVFYGLTGQIGVAPNQRVASDFIVGAVAEVTQELVTEAQNHVTQQQVIVAVTLIFATKINWWATNHHIGQATMSPYMAKVTKALLSIKSVDLDMIKKIVHQIGHWASTHRVLNLLHIRNDVTFAPLQAVAAGARITLTDDLFLRVSAMPAGTARHALCHAIMTKYGGNKIFMFSSKLAELAALKQEVDAVIEAGRRNVTLSRAADAAALAVDPRLEYHMGATYLLGGNTARAEFGTVEMTGHLGSVLYHLFRESTLTRSPHITTPSGKDLRKHYDQSDSYTQNWDDLCLGVATAMIVTNSDLVNAVCGVGDDARADRETWSQFQVMNGIYADIDLAHAAFDSFNDIFAKYGAGGPKGAKGGRGKEEEEPKQGGSGTGKKQKHRKGKGGAKDDSGDEM
ncbi:hypothetical protein [Shahe qinvirus-like virus 1]|uniref:Nucleocapsid protein n=1 Tax=Shahe qinvirus-like virus 1 TaxID=1923453 RepID=A0A1L3KL30_9VIRU|nr:hypothetical protein [Shahe qinvirus-like virus 1]APG78072.1 hypothetical protein [Shahe qinvirus-like virus 1]